MITLVHWKREINSSWLKVTCVKLGYAMCQKATHLNFTRMQKWLEYESNSCVEWKNKQTAIPKNWITKLETKFPEQEKKIENLWSQKSEIA